MPETTAGAHDDNVVPRLSICFTQSRVHCHTSTQERCGSGRIKAIWDGCDVVCRTKSVLLEGAGGIVAGDFLWKLSANCTNMVSICTYATEAARIHASTASLTRLTNSSHPLDTNSVTDLDCRVFSSGTHLYNLADSFVTSNLTCLCGKGEGLPGVEHDAHI